MQYNVTISPQKTTRRRRATKQQLPHFTSMMIALLFITTAVYAAAGSTAHSNSLNRHLSKNNPHQTNNNEPQRFLRWRTTLESPIILTNEDDNKDGTYLEFNNINLRLSPVNLPSYEGQIGSSVYETYNNNNNVMDGIMRVLQTVLESHINLTLHETSSEEEDITQGSTTYVKLGNVKLVSASYSNDNDDDLTTSESSEPVRNLKETTLSLGNNNDFSSDSERLSETVRSLQEERELQSPKEGSITVQIEGGEIYYQYGLGGELLSTLPTKDELSSLVIGSLESLPRSIQSTTYTTSQVDNLGEDSDQTVDLLTRSTKEYTVTGLLL